MTKEGILMRVLAVFTSLWLLTGAPAAAIDSRMIPVPVLSGRVSDAADVLSIEDHERLSKLLRNYEQETKHQIAVLIVPTLAGEAIESFCLRVAKVWRLGRKGIDDGIVVCMAMTERRVRIELGIGINRYISNAEAKEIIDSEMTPLFSKGDFAGGLERGLKRLMEEGRRLIALNTRLFSPCFAQARGVRSMYARSTHAYHPWRLRAKLLIRTVQKTNIDPLWVRGTITSPIIGA
jgi:uncharacterized membrane protein YgcG